MPTGTMVGARLRCQGYMCPQWALDISRYDPLRQINTEFQYDLSEALPLAPTYQRDFLSYTAFDPASRIYTAVATDYPEQGIDSYWQVQINGAVNASTPVVSNVMVPHPDASANNPGSMKLVQLKQLSDARILAMFMDGSVHTLDLTNQKYTKAASLIPSGASSSDLIVTGAHTVDGLKLKSFLVDAKEKSYLVVTDFSVTPATVTTPLYITPIPGQPGKEIPLYSLMMPKGPADATPQLVLMMHGNFDSLSFVDETTGIQTPLFASLSDDMCTTPSFIYCDTNTKDCDLWNTIAYDPVANTIYFQSHTQDGDDGVPMANIMEVAWTQSAVNKDWYPNVWSVNSPVQFGYSSYQWVQFEGTDRKL